MSHPSITRRLIAPNPLVVAIVFVCVVFTVAYFAVVSYADADPNGTLLTSQALIEHGNIYLDPYPDTLQDYQQYTVLGHRTYWYPIGTSLLSMPAVWLARQAGLDMAVTADDHALQHLLAALSLALAALISFDLARRYLGLWLGLLFAILFSLGSSAASTLGSALWSINATVVAMLATLWFLVRADLRGGAFQRGDSVLMGLLLLIAFACRPTAAVFIAAVLVYLLVRRPRVGLVTAGVAMVGLLLFIAFCYSQYGTWLPYYYLSTHRSAAPDLGQIAAGLLISPARGLLIYNPFLWIALVATLLAGVRIFRSPLATCCLAVAVLLFVAIGNTNSSSWWGGWSFGSRLLVDALPALFVLTLIAAQALLDPLRPQWQRAIVPALGGVALVAGVGINTAQGLYNPATYTWNAVPHIDQHPEYIFSWRYPQFLATDAQIRERFILHYVEPRPVLASPLLSSASAEPFFENWYEIEEYPWGTIRWSAGKQPRIWFKLSDTVVSSLMRPQMALTIAFYGPQDVSISLNDEQIGVISGEGFDPQVFTFPFDAKLLKSYSPGDPDYNVIEFGVSNPNDPAKVAPDQDARTLGIMLWQIELQPQP